ncbi:uncharacterized protein LOC126895276 isoform X2 [Daktulosphaira vitifoliae]|uniref:uncharacterized protein LOC126895276 isoform X2 n=1 Tax=Daktulosphaira vitifoliae TaxID=58002 RepID=UPI0021AA4CD2|nr:uncharacterized protein LOC126895276 isoform X2 [Daktulosphaira vitifoliae]
MKMAIILNIKVYLCMFFAFLHTEGIRNTNENVKIIKNFLSHPGWNNINDVELIKYRNNQHKLKDLIIVPVTILNCDNCIRQAMLFLGCSYTNDLDLINYSLTKFQQHCFELLDSSYVRAHHCTVTLLMKMIEIISIAKCMKGALDAIEKYHTVTRISGKRKRFILSRLLTNLQEDEILLTRLSTSLLSIKNVLGSIKQILLWRNNDLNEEKSFCQLKQLDFDSLWQISNKEFNIFLLQGKFQELFILLSDNISNFIETTITQKYFELGFIFDSNTNRTFLSVQPSTSDNHDIAQNPSTNFTQNTNYVNTQEAIQQNDITTYPSIQHTNNVETQEDIRQENNNCEVNDDSDVLIYYPKGQEPFNKYL